MRSERDVAGSLQVSAARALARTLVVGFGVAEEEERALTELQKVDLLTAALTCFDGLEDELAGFLEVEGLLSAHAEAAVFLGGQTGEEDV